MTPTPDRVAEKTAAHTPGPWEATLPGAWIQTVGDPYGHGQMHIADIRGWDHLTGQDACALPEREAVMIQHANARLIAAAPELLDAARHAFVLLESISELVNRGERDRDYHEERNALRAAIAKAEGR